MNQKKFFFTLFLIALASISFAQELVNIKGIVADSATFKPIGFVNVFVKRTHTGTTTDQKGHFNINAQATDTIRFSFVGYKTLELSAFGWEPSVILMTEEVTILKTLTIRGESDGNQYEHLFDEENLKLKNSRKPLPFYYTKDKKDKILLSRAKQEQARVRTYVDLIVKDDKVKIDLMKRHHLTEAQYFHLLAMFNEKNYTIMYYLTEAELLTMLYRFFDINSDQ